MNQLIYEGMDVMEALSEKKPIVVYSGDDGLVNQWKAIWERINSTIGPMMEDREEWIYLHHRQTIDSGSPVIMCGRDEEVIGDQFRRYEEGGLIKVNNDNVNKKKLFQCFANKRTGIFYRADLTFHTYANPDGGPQCPILWGLNSMAFGHTYIRVNYRTLNREEKMLAVRSLGNILKMNPAKKQKAKKEQPNPNREQTPEERQKQLDDLERLFETPAQSSKGKNPAPKKDQYKPSDDAINP